MLTDMKFQRLRESLSYLQKVGSSLSSYGDDFYKQVLEARNHIPVTDVEAHKRLDDLLESKGNSVAALATIGTSAPIAFASRLAAAKIGDKFNSLPAAVATLVGGLAGSAYGGHKVGKYVSKNLKLRALNKFMENYHRQQQEE